MKKIPIIVGVMLALGGIPMIRITGQEPPKKEADVKELMQQKLKHSQKILGATLWAEVTFWPGAQKGRTSSTFRSNTPSGP